MIHRHSRSSRGQAIMEFLMTIPLLLLILFLIVSFGKGFRMKERSVVGARHATWHTAETGHVGGEDPWFEQTFFQGGANGGYGGRASPNDGRQDYEDLLAPTPGAMGAYADYLRDHESGEVRQHAAVDYVPPGSVYHYSLTRIGETSAREHRPWHYREIDCWRFFGDQIVVEPNARRNDVYAAFEQAAQQGFATVSDPVLLQALQGDLSRHRDRMRTHYDQWISTWNRG